MQFSTVYYSLNTGNQNRITLSCPHNFTPTFPVHQFSFTWQPAGLSSMLCPTLSQHWRGCYWNMLGKISLVFLLYPSYEENLTLFSCAQHLYAKLLKGNQRKKKNTTVFTSALPAFNFYDVTEHWHEYLTVSTFKNIVEWNTVHQSPYLQTFKLELRNGSTICKLRPPFFSFSYYHLRIQTQTKTTKKKHLKKKQNKKAANKQSPTNLCPQTSEIPHFRISWIKKIQQVLHKHYLQSNALTGLENIYFFITDLFQWGFSRYWHAQISINPPFALDLPQDMKLPMLC